MKTIEEKAEGLYPDIDYTVNGKKALINRSNDRYIYCKGHEEGKAEANAEWQEKVRLSTLLIRKSVDDLKTANYEIDRRDLYKVIYDALEIIGEK